MASYSIRDVKIVHLLDRAEKDIMDLKSRQYIGKRVLQTKKSVGNEKYLSNSEPYPDGSGTAFKFVYKTIIFKADSQLSPYGRLIVDIFKADGVTIAPKSDNISIFYLNFIVTNVDDGILKWQVDIRGPAAQNFYVRFSVAATDSGVITANDVQ